MSLLDRATDRLTSALSPSTDENQFQQQRQYDESRESAEQNVGNGERAVSIAAGSILGLLGLSRRSMPGLLIAGVGAAMLHRGITGHCYLYDALDIDTALDGQSQPTDEQDIATHGVHIEQALLINRPAEDLYGYWRNFQNLPQIMSYLQDVRVDGDGRRSHWVAKAPKLLGGSVEWDAEITADDPNSRIAWRSLPGSQVDTVGEIRFSKAMGDRGTEVHVSIHYVPPAGKLGHFLTSMLGENPRRVVREDLRNFKRIMEIGEVISLVGQPMGSCAGTGGRRYSEDEWRPLYR